MAYVGSHYEWNVAAATFRRYYYAGGQRVATRNLSTQNFMLSDHLGSTTVVADVNGIRSSEVRYKPWGEDRYSYGTTPTSYRYTGQRQEASIGLYFYGARWYDPALGRFTSPDTIIPAQQWVQGNDRYAYTSNNPIRYNDPTGHYGEDVHYDLTYQMTYAAAFQQAMNNNSYNYEQAMVFATSLAGQVAQADLDVDSFSKRPQDTSVLRPGEYTISTEYGTISIDNGNTPHWWTTPEAESVLNSAETTGDFGRAMHGYQDSYSHWQKTGNPGTPGEIWDGHFANNRFKVCEFGFCDVHSGLDNYDPKNNPYHPWWANIDNEMRDGMKPYIRDFVEEQWADQYE